MSSAAEEALKIEQEASEYFSKPIDRSKPDQGAQIFREVMDWLKENPNGLTQLNAALRNFSSVDPHLPVVEVGERSLDMRPGPAANSHRRWMSAE
jgi:hypothetical protein